MSPNLDPTGPASAGSPFSEAMYRYDQARDAGRVLAPEDLTSDPELQAELREAIDADQAFRRSVEPAPEADEQPPSLPGYVLHEKIGEGGMGIVYRATDRTFDREVAVKLIKRGRRAGPAAAARFRTEAGISARLEHPNIPPVYALGELPDGSPFLAMKLVRGETLDVLLKARATPADDLPRFVGVFEAVCQAVGYAHSRGVVHRDLKPHNVMVGQHGEVQVMDWGLSRELAPGSAAPDRREGSSGTPAYMAPEQAQGELAAPRADVFALGGILCAILTGEPPFRGSSALDVRARAKAADLADAVDRLNGCGADGELVTLALWCLAAEPGARPADGRAVAGQVAAYRAGVEQRLQVAQANRAAADARAVEQARRRKVIQRLAGAVAAVLLLGIGGTTVGLVLMSLAREAEASARGDAEAKRALAETAQAAEAAQKKVAEDKQAAAERAEGEKERQRKAAVEIKDFLASVLVQGDPRRATKDQGADPDRTLRAALDWAAKGIEGRFADQPEIAADLRNTIGLAYLSLGAHAAAGGHFRAALDLREQALGPSHPDTFTSVHNIAYLYRTTGDYGVAVPFLKRAVAGQEETLGPDHPETLLSVHNLAELYGVMGDHGATEPLLKRASAGLEKALGPDHPNTLLSVHSLGSLYSIMGDHGAAEPLLKRAAAGLERALGPDHPDALAGADSLAGLYHRKGDHQEAEPLYRRALAGRERVLGSNHPNTLMTVNNLGLLYQAAGDHRSAEPLLRRAVAGQEKALGPDHPDTLLSVNNLALFYKIIGYYQAAEPLYRRAMTGQEKVLGPNHPDTLQTAGNLGILLIEMGRPVEAVPLLERAYAGRGKYPAQLTRYGGALVEAYTRAERWADGARAVGEWLAEWRAKLKPGSPELGVLLAQSGKMLLRLDPAAAEPVLRECLDLWEKLDPKAWTTASARSLLGEALLLQGKLAAAEPLFVAGYEGLLADRKNIPPQGMGNLPDAAGRLAQVYLALGKPAEAARWRAERAKYPPDQAPPPRLKG